MQRKSAKRRCMTEQTWLILINMKKHLKYPMKETYIILYYRLIPKISDHVPLPEEEAKEHSAHYLGGGGPEIHIEKSTGKVLEWKLAK